MLKIKKGFTFTIIFLILYKLEILHFFHSGFLASFSVLSASGSGSINDDFSYLFCASTSGSFIKIKGMLDC